MKKISHIALIAGCTGALLLANFFLEWAIEALDKKSAEQRREWDAHMASWEKRSAEFRKSDEETRAKWKEEDARMAKSALRINTWKAEDLCLREMKWPIRSGREGLAKERIPELDACIQARLATVQPGELLK